MTDRTPRFLQHPALAVNGVVHGFFGRHGGVSRGLFASLNCGFGSSDEPGTVATNRALARIALGLGEGDVLTPYQIHSAAVAVVDAPWPAGKAPQADGLVTRRRGLALGILTADCAPILFADSEAGIVGAAHAGWKGAFAGVIEATIDAMEELGARRPRIRAAIGPTIRQASYEVRLDFLGRFLAQDPRNERFFVAGVDPDHRQFDLPAYILARLEAASIEAEDLDRCTYALADDYFSFRRATHRGEADNGRNIALIALTP